jgi:hypothetical protein
MKAATTLPLKGQSRHESDDRPGRSTLEPSISCWGQQLRRERIVVLPPSSIAVEITDEFCFEDSDKLGDYTLSIVLEVFDQACDLAVPQMLAGMIEGSSLMMRSGGGTSGTGN